MLIFPFLFLSFFDELWLFFALILTTMSGFAMRIHAEVAHVFNFSVTRSASIVYATSGTSYLIISKQRNVKL